MRHHIWKIRPVGVLAAVTISATIISVSVLILGLRERELDHARREMMSLTDLFMEQTEQNFQEVDLTLLGIQEKLMTGYGKQFALDSLPVHLLMSSRTAGMQQLESIFIADPQGAVVNTSRDYPAAALSVADRDYYQVLRHSSSSALFVGRPVRSGPDNQWSLHLSRALRSSDGKLVGVLVAVIGIKQLENQYTNIKLDYPRPIGIYLADGTLIASLPHQDAMIGAISPELKSVHFSTRKKDIQTIQSTKTSGDSVDMTIGRLDGYPLLVSVTEDDEMALSSWRMTAVPIGIGGAFVSLFTAIAAGFIINRLKSREALAQALATADDLYQNTLNSVMDAIVAVDSDGKIVLFNPAAEKMFGLKRFAVLGKNFEDLMPERFREAHRVHVQRFLSQDSDVRIMAPQMEITGLRANGDEFPIESTVSKSLVGDQLQMTAVLRDVTDRHRSQEELKQLNSQLRQLTSSLQAVREQERQRLSRELHDELGQQLTGLKLHLSWLGNRLRSGRAASEDTITEMAQLIHIAMSSVRRLSTELRPLMLEDLDFEDAIAEHCRTFAKRSHIDVVLDVEHAKQLTDDAQKTALFRILQESLNNVVKHARATQIRVNLEVKESSLSLSIQDNGQGMDESVKTYGIGLLSMRERAISIGASFQVSSSANDGTTVAVVIPLEVAS